MYCHHRVGSRGWLLGGALVLAAAAGWAQQPAVVPPAPPLAWTETGLQKLTGLSRQVQCELTEDKPAELKQVPEGLVEPRFGVIRIGRDSEQQAFCVCVDRPAGQFTRVWVDTTATGTLAPLKEWARNANNDGGSGKFTLDVSVCGQTRKASFACAMVDPKDDAVAWARNSLLYAADCGWRGTVRLGTRTFNGVIFDLSGKLAFEHAKAKEGMTLLVDLNGDGQWDRRLELFDLGAPFTTGGAPWRFKTIKADGTPSIEEISLVARTTIEVGKIAPTFGGTALSGNNVLFPRDYAGKIVLVDFWAMWCVYCREALPDTVKTYRQFHDKGFDILGVDLDGPGRARYVVEFCQKVGMPWEELYDGLAWDSNLVDKYSVEGIPFSLLVDGDTGKILEVDPDVAELPRLVAKHLTAKHGGKLD